MRRATLMMLVGCAIAVRVGSAAGRAEAPEQQSQRRGDTIVARLDLTIADQSPTSPHSFGAIGGVAVDRRGQIYVADRRAAHVVVFAPDGKRIATIGRQGQGPGEFRAPHGVSFAPDGSLYVRAVNGVSRFLPDSATGAVTRFDRRFAGPLYPDWTNPRAGRVDLNGRLQHPYPITPAGGVRRHSYIRYTAQGVAVDTLWVPPYADMPAASAWYATGPAGGRMVPGLNMVPFAPIPVWDVTARGTIISGDGTQYLLTETDPSGRVLRRFERTLPPARIPASERAESTRALRRRLDSIPVPMSRMTNVPEAVREARLPAVYPSYLGVYVAEDERVWVRRWPRPGRARDTIFDVFDREGRFLTTVALPVELALLHHPVILPDAIIGVARDRETDVDSVVRFRYRMPS